MSIALQKRKRLSPEESRENAIFAARDLLREEGVAAITLKSVAARVGRTHANLLHHFGSAAGLHRALADRIAHEVAAEIVDTIQRMRRGEASLGDVIEHMFEGFRREKIGELIAWVAMTRQREALEPLIETIGEVVRDITDPGDERPLDRATLSLVLFAIGDSLAGEEMARACGLECKDVRSIAKQQIVAILSA